MLLAIRFFEPLFGALIVVPFFGLPPWLLRFKLVLRCLPWQSSPSQGFRYVQ